MTIRAGCCVIDRAYRLTTFVITSYSIHYTKLYDGEGDWKTSALVRIMKVMGTNMPGGNSFMERNNFV